MSVQTGIDNHQLIDISDPGDARLDFYRAMKGAARHDPRRYIVESELAVANVLRSGSPIESLLLSPSKYERLKHLLPPDAVVYRVSEQHISAVVGFDLHRGAAVCGPRPTSRPVPIETLANRPRFLVVAVEYLSDEANLGALVRNCRAFGVEHLIVDQRGADIYSRKALRVSVGNVLSLPITIGDPAALVAELKARIPGTCVAAATVHPEAVSLRAYRRPERLVLLLGNEGAGVSPRLLTTADQRLMIPIDLAADSLNVAAATAVLLYAVSDQA